MALIVLLAICAGAAFAQGVDLRGTVSDSITGQRIPFVNVTVSGTARGASSNVTGFYLIPSIPPREYDIAASVIGYRRKTQRVVVRRGRPIDLDFLLTSVPVEVQEILVTAARKREVFEINTGIHLMEQREVKHIPAAVQHDIFQSLKILPGVVSTNDVSSRFFVRGGAADENLVLLDGMKIFSPFHAMGVFSVFDPDIVQNVELSTGAFPPQYGGRLSSVVSISSRDGRSDRLSGRASLNFLSAKLQLEGPAVPGTTWMVNLRKSIFSETFERLINQDIPVSFYDGFAKFNANFPGGAKFDLSVLTSSDKLSFTQTLRSFGRPQTTLSNFSWRTTALNASYSNLVGDRMFIQLSGFYSGYQANRDSSTPRGPATTSNTVKEHGLRALVTYYTSSQDLCIFGFEFGFPTIKYDLTNPSGHPRRLLSSFTEGTVWFRYQIFSDPWSYDLGIREDFGALLRGELGVHSLQPRLHVNYTLLGSWKLKGALGLCSQRMMTVNNEDEVMSIFDAWVKNPDGFAAEKALHFVLGANGYLSEATSLGIESYYKNYSSLVVYNRTKTFESDPDYITGTGRSYGIEMLLRSRVLGIDLYGAYTIGWVRIHNSGLDYYPQYDRRHSLNIMVTSQPLSGLDLTLRWEFGSGFPYTANLGYYDRLMLGTSLSTPPVQFETGQPYLALGEKNAWRLPAYHRLDASLTYRFAVGGMKGSAGVQLINIYDKVNVFYFSRYTGSHVDLMRFFPSATVSIEY